MKKQILTCLMALAALNVSAQKLTNTVKLKLDFFKAPHFVNGKAMVTFKAFYGGLHEEAPPYEGKDPRTHKMLLNTRIHSGSDINFYLQGDTTIYDAPYVSSINLIDKISVETPVYLTIIVFEHYAGYDTKHFFVVTGISSIPTK